jgi:hypothetical protein
VREGEVEGMGYDGWVMMVLDGVMNNLESVNEVMDG